ncbi:hypothetical protein K431DRAFT_281999 [Polychaeton citri CBS 116435]|uniref:Brl1/Brr6 domain-containing protein n=1 Tax=Polychaeton citri CBS 116435 TaxID=1314669 RepID=A0A9P4QEW1_9PEZI|nr:hypothetical protein K431DRAFT_281999 [Polychaeton citri CBS 116435]
MSRRTHESPMDFEYSNGTGPLDLRSPFAQLSQNSQRRIPGSVGGIMAKKSALSSSTSSDRMDVDEAIGGSNSTNYAGTPMKQPSQRTPVFTRTQSTPAAKPLPPVPAFNSLFSTPRRGADNYDDSSAGETPRSPERGDDSEAPTPDTHFNSALDKMDNMSFKALQKDHSPAKGRDRERPTSSSSRAGRRDSIWMLVKKSLYSPGGRESSRGSHDLHQVKDHRIRKQRSRDGHSRSIARTRRHSMSDSELGDESELQVATPPRTRSSPRKGSRQLSPQKHDTTSTPSLPFPGDESRPHWISTLFTFISSHPTVPHILSFYAQLFFNLFLLAGCAWIMYCGYSAVRSDIDREASGERDIIIGKMIQCEKEWKSNLCDGPRGPAMEQLCLTFEQCFSQNPDKVARARVSATVFARIFNAFIEPISYKAMIFTFGIVFGCFAVSNFAFGVFRDRNLSHGGNGNQLQPAYWQPPPTPQRTFSGEGQQGWYGPGTPWHQPMPGLEPAPSGGYSQIEGRGSPVRRLVYN